MATATADSVASAQPRTLPHLLRMLGVNDKPVSQQWPQIMTWLEHNEASRELWTSFLANGYGLHLEQGMHSFNRPGPRRPLGKMCCTRVDSPPADARSTPAARMERPRVVR